MSCGRVPMSTTTWAWRTLSASRRKNLWPAFLGDGLHLAGELLDVLGGDDGAFDDVDALALGGRACRDQHLSGDVEGLLVAQVAFGLKHGGSLRARVACAASIVTRRTRGWGSRQGSRVADRKVTRSLVSDREVWRNGTEIVILAVTRPASLARQARKGSRVRHLWRYLRCTPYRST